MTIRVQKLHSLTPTTMTTSIIKKIFITFLCFVLISAFAVPGFADNSVITNKNTTLVTILCEVDPELPTDDYSPIVVTLLNTTTNKTSSYELYKYNQFSEWFEMENGVYTILYARIYNRYDLILDVEAEKTFDIGLIKTIVFKVSDSNLMVTEKDTQKHDKTNTTNENTLHTLFSIENESTTNIDAGTSISDVSVTEPSSANFGTDTSSYSGTTIEVTKISQYDPQATATETTTETKIITTNIIGSLKAKETEEKLTKVIAVSISVVFLFIIAIIVLIFKKRKG